MTNKTKNLINKKAYVLKPGEKIPSDLLDQLKKANKDCKGYFPKYIRTIEDIFELEPLPPITVEHKFFLGGFIEGEASISVSAKKLKNAKFGLMIDPEFNITQHINGVCHLHAVLHLFKAGRMSFKSGSNATMVLTIDNRRTLQEKVVPYWEKYVNPLSSPTKRERMANFIRINKLLENKVHHNRESMINELLPLWDEMRMQKQKNETFGSLEEAQEYVRSFERLCVNANDRK